MSASILPTTLTSVAALVSLCVTVLFFAVGFYRRLRIKNIRLFTAINNMSQGLNMFDAQGRIVLLNQRYLEMYKLSPAVVKPGCSLRELIQYRKSTGLFSGDVDSYCKKIIDEVSQGKNLAHYVPA